MSSSPFPKTSRPSTAWPKVCGMFLCALLAASAPQAMGAPIEAPFQFRLLVLPSNGIGNPCGHATVGLSATSGIAVDCMAPPPPGGATGPAPAAPVNGSGLMRLGDRQDIPTLFPGFGVVDRFYTIRPGLVERELMVAF